MWFLCKEIASRHPFDAQNLEVNPGFLKILGIRL